MIPAYVASSTSPPPREDVECASFSRTSVSEKACNLPSSGRNQFSLWVQTDRISRKVQRTRSTTLLRVLARLHTAVTDSTSARPPFIRVMAKTTFRSVLRVTRKGGCIRALVRHKVSDGPTNNGGSPHYKEDVRRTLTQRCRGSPASRSSILPSDESYIALRAPFTPRVCQEVIPQSLGPGEVVQRVAVRGLTPAFLRLSCRHDHESYKILKVRSRFREGFPTSLPEEVHGAMDLRVATARLGPGSSTKSLRTEFNSGVAELRRCRPQLAVPIG